MLPVFAQLEYVRSARCRRRLTHDVIHQAVNKVQPCPALGARLNRRVYVEGFHVVGIEGKAPVGERNAHDVIRRFHAEQYLPHLTRRVGVDYDVGRGLLYGEIDVKERVLGQPQLLSDTVHKVRDGAQILEATVTARASDGAKVPGTVRMESTVTPGEKVEQRLTFTLAKPRKGVQIVLEGAVAASVEAFPAETHSQAQKRFPMVRTSAGLSRNLRNNAVYDRRWDWVLVGPGDGATRITPTGEGKAARAFGLQCKGAAVRIVFRPRFYQKHKNLMYYEPWTYKVWEESVAGFCTWWAYKGGITQATIDEICAVFQKKHLVDFGYKYLQIDAGWATGSSPQGYPNWNKKFPDGPKHVVGAIKKAGMKPGIHTAVVFRRGDKIVDGMAAEHPDWFLPKPDGSVLTKGTYTLDPFNEAALAGLIRPTYKGLKEQGWDYVKIDGEGNLMAWGYSEYPEYFEKHGRTPGEALRRLNQAA